MEHLLLLLPLECFVEGKGPVPEGLLTIPELLSIPTPNGTLPEAKRGTTTAIFLLSEEIFERIYGPEERAAITSRIKIDHYLVTPQVYEKSSEIWPEVEMIFSGWGMVRMDEAFFRRFPKLKVVFYAAGTVRGFVTDALWQRDVLLTNASAANAIPVCEFTISQILFALKHGWQKALHIRRHGKVSQQL